MTIDKELIDLKNLMVLLVSLVWIVLQSSVLLPTAAAQIKCDARVFGQFIAEAQSLGQKAEELGREVLLCPIDSQRQAAIYWLSFSLAMQGKKSLVAGLSQALVPPGAAAERLHVLHKAWFGDVSGLANRVRLGQQGYADDASSLLVLARNLIRTEQFQDGFKIYQQLISMPESSESAEVEKLYALIWAQDFAAAANQVAALRRFQLSAYLKQSVDRADALLEKFGIHPMSFEARHQPWLTAEGKDWVDKAGFRRRSLALSYQGAVNAGAAAFEFGHPLNSNRQHEAQVEFGKLWQAHENFQVLSNIGLYTGEKGALTGRLDPSLKLGDTWLFGLGLRREPVAIIELPMVPESNGLMRTTGSLSLDFRNRFTTTFSLARDGRDAFFTLFRAEVALLDLVSPESEGGFGFFVPIEFIQHPKPAAATISYPKQLSVGLGSRLAYSFDRSWHFFGESKLSLINRSYYAANKSFSKLFGAEARIELRYFMQKNYFIFIGGHRSYVDRNPDEPVDERRSLVNFGISLVGP